MLGRRELNRALLARNLLLERSPLSPLDAVRHLVGLQAQEPQEPYVGLFSRLPASTRRTQPLLDDRVLVRTLMMRRTIHLLTAADCLGLRGLHQPMLEQRMRRRAAHPPRGVDEAELAAAGYPLFDAEPRT